MTDHFSCLKRPDDVKPFDPRLDGTLSASCMRCASGEIGIGTDAHRWFRALDAPRWLKLPTEGFGFQYVGETAKQYGTSSLAEAIVVAGRQLGAGDCSG